MARPPEPDRSAGNSGAEKRAVLLLLEISVVVSGRVGSGRGCQMDLQGPERKQNPPPARLLVYYEWCIGGARNLNDLGQTIRVGAS